MKVHSIELQPLEAGLSRTLVLLHGYGADENDLLPIAHELDRSRECGDTHEDMHRFHRFGIDPLPFNKLLDLREERIKPRELEPVGLFDSYLKQISIVIDAVDRLEK